jgi:hypothetical protein
VRPVYLAINTQTLIALPAEELILILLMIMTEPKIEYGFLTQWFPLMFTGNLILVVFIIALLAEVGLLRETEVRRQYVPATLAHDLLR